MGVVKKKDLTFCTIISICVGIFLLFLACYKYVGFYYEINDDISMQAIASGKSFGYPDAHLTFIQYPLGVLISFLFKVFPGTDWYGLFMIGAIMLCCIIIVLRVVKLLNHKKNRLLGMILCGLILVVFGFDNMIFFQFTTVSGILASAALFLLITEQDGKFSASKVLIVGLFCLSLCVRKKVFLMFAPASLLCVLIRIVREAEDNNLGSLKSKCRSSITKNRAFLLICFILFVLYFLVSFINKQAYSNHEWQEYFLFRTYRSNIVDYDGFPPFVGNQMYYRTLGINEEEQACLSTFFGVLPDIDSEKLKYIYSLNKANENKSFTGIVCKAVSVLKSVLELKSGLYWKLGLWVSVIFALLYTPSQVIRSSKVPILFYSILQLGIFVYLLINGRFPARVFFVFCIECVTIVFGFFLKALSKNSLFQEKHVEQNSKVLGFAVAVMIAFSISSVYSTISSVGSYNSGIEKYQEYIALVNSNPERFYIVPTGTVSTKKQFFVNNYNPKANAIGTAGWSSKSPWQYKLLKSNGIDVDKEYLLQDGVYMLTKNLVPADKLTNYYLSEGLIHESYEIVEVREMPASGYYYVLKWNKAE